jgi:hypothetical protein
MEKRKTSWRPGNFADKHDVSPSFIYNEIRERRLRAHKAADGVTIITEEDEADWLDGMPTIGAPPKPNTTESIESTKSGAPESDATKSIEPTEFDGGGVRARAGPS